MWVVFVREVETKYQKNIRKLNKDVVGFLEGNVGFFARDVDTEYIRNLNMDIVGRGKEMWVV